MRNILTSIMLAAKINIKKFIHKRKLPVRDDKNENSIFYNSEKLLNWLEEEIELF